MCAVGARWRLRQLDWRAEGSVPAQRLFLLQGRGGASLPRRFCRPVARDVSVGRQHLNLTPNAGGGPPLAARVSRRSVAPVPAPFTHRPIYMCVYLCGLNWGLTGGASRFEVVFVLHFPLGGRFLWRRPRFSVPR